jgi:hypothetical protein
VILLIILILDEIKFSARPLIIIPIITGTVTTKAIFIAIPVIEISAVIETPKKLAELITINGTDIMLNKLVTAVNEIDKATSPLANFVNTFEVTPPGAAAIIIKPMAIGVGKFNIKATPKAIMGRINNCEKKPTKKSFGVLNILVKSLRDRPRPSPSMINARQIGAILVTISIHFNFL